MAGDNDICINISLQQPIYLVIIDKSVKTQYSFMTNCMHKNIIKHIPYSFKTKKSQRFTDGQIQENKGVVHYSVIGLTNLP